MTITARILALVDLTLQDPRRAARALLAEDVPLSARSMGLLLIAVISAFLATAGIGMESGPPDPLTAVLGASPFRVALFQWVMLALSVLLIHGVGRSFGGTGNLPDALLLTVWLQFLMLVPQVLQLLVMLISPALSGIIALGALGVFLWLLTSFVAELHGFPSRWRVFLGILATILGMGLVLAVLLTLLLGPKVLMPDV